MRPSGSVHRRPSRYARTAGISHTHLAGAVPAPTQLPRVPPRPLITRSCSNCTQTPPGAAAAAATEGNRRRHAAHPGCGVAGRAEAYSDAAPPRAVAPAPAPPRLHAHRRTRGVPVGPVGRRGVIERQGARGGEGGRVAHPRGTRPANLAIVALLPAARPRSGLTYGLCPRNSGWEPRRVATRPANQTLLLPRCRRARADPDADPLSGDPGGAQRSRSR